VAGLTNVSYKDFLFILRKSAGYLWLPNGTCKESNHESNETSYLQLSLQASDLIAAKF
jgi:hypothetical protein